MLAFAKLIGWWVLRTLFAVEYHGVENVPLEGAVIIAGNHPSYLDPVLVGLPVKRTMKFMAWDALFRVPILGSIIRTCGAFPVDLRKGKGESAFLEARRILNEGNVLGIFPEGQRSEHGPMGDLKTGTARLAIETGSPIVPVTIGGAFRAWPKWRLLPKPAKIIVRFHPPIKLDPVECAARRDDRTYHHQVMEQVASQINRSLAPALRGSDAWERRYRQPPSHVRSYEWAPTIAAVIATLICLYRGNVPWLKLWAVVGGYWLYLIADLLLIKPTRFAKWIRNSMPIWLILIWHRMLTEALGLPFGQMMGWLLAVLLAVFFVFFYEDYFNLQKFVRGIVVVYYFSLVLLLRWPNEIGVLVAITSFMIVFCHWFGVAFRWAISAVSLIVLAAALYLVSTDPRLTAYSLLAIAATAYLQTFSSFAYDIRRQLVTNA